MSGARFLAWQKMVAGVGSFLVLGCSAFLAYLALRSVEDQRQQSLWERREALRLQAHSVASEFSTQLRAQVERLWNRPLEDAPVELGEQLQRKMEKSPWIWHVVLLSEKGRLLYPTMPWEDPEDTVLLASAKKVSCHAFRLLLRKSRAGQAARLSAALSVLARFPSCPLRRALRVPLLYDAHLRHVHARSWLFTSSQGRTMWQLRSPDYVMILRMIGQRWIGFTIPLQTTLPLLQKDTSFVSCWLERMRSPFVVTPHSLSIPLSGHLEGYRLSFRYRSMLPDRTWLLRVILLMGTFFTWLAWGGVLWLLYRQALWSQQRSSLFAAIAHELKTPVAAQLSLLGHLQKQDSSPTSRSYQHALFKETKRLQQLMDNLLALNRFEISSSFFVLINLTKMTHEVLESVEHIADEKQQALFCDTRTPCWVKADPIGLELALRNLVDNAIKYTPEGGTINIDITKQAREIHWSIQDDGPGIPPTFVHSLFLPFLRGESREQPGSGLGLYIAKGILQQARGSLSLVPTAGQGAHFRIVLPIAEERKSEE